MTPASAKAVYFFVEQPAMMADWTIAPAAAVDTPYIRSPTRRVHEVSAETDRDWDFLDHLGKPSITSGEAVCSECLPILEGHPDWPGAASGEELDEVRQERLARREMEFWGPEGKPKLPEDPVRVRRQWNDHRVATVPFASVRGIHLDHVSGGTQTHSPQPFLTGYVWCWEVWGDIAHSCAHGPPPHEIKVIITHVDNPVGIFQRLMLAGKRMGRPGTPSP